MSTPILYVRNQIIARAMRLAQASSDMAVMDDQKLLHAGEALACLLRAWQEKKVNLWTEEWLTVPLVASSTVYYDDKYYRCIRGHIASATSQPGVGAETTTYWLEDETGADVATPWASGAAYTCTAEIYCEGLYDLLSAFIRDDLTDYGLCLADQMEFFKEHDYQTPQIPTRIWFDKKTGYIRLSPIPDKTTYVLHFLGIRTLENLLLDGQPPDIPASYQDALAYCLAANLADESGLPIARCQYLRMTGERYLAQVMSGPFQDKRKTQGIQSMYPRLRK